MFIRLFLISSLIPLQSCSNTRIGEELENSFEVIKNSNISEKTMNVIEQNEPNEIKKINSSNEVDDKKNVQVNITKNNSISKKETLSPKSINSRSKVIFNPQPYRIILKLSAANPSAPAETVTNALRKAGVEFEVEKIERFEEKSLLNDSSLKR
tara:strand:+ start:409 stop:870 length:462 start_codon:yes stop_codon:yes gene_type:complete